MFNNAHSSGSKRCSKCLPSLQVKLENNIQNVAVDCQFFALIFQKL